MTPQAQPDKPVVALTGASGFVGAAVVRALLKRTPLELRALSRSDAFCTENAASEVTAIHGDLHSADALDRFLRPGCSVLNFAYDGKASAQDNLAAAFALAEGCVRNHVRRVIHCSTAVVVGKSNRARIDESTNCDPQTPYERTKLAIEEIFREKARGNYQLVILRPTAVFGPGGRNLIKMANDLVQGPRIVNRLRSFANGSRRMNLVAVENVAAAAIHLLEAAEVDGETFIISDDEHAQNNFRDVEECLLRALDLPQYSVHAKLPADMLGLVLRLRGRSLTNPDTRFSVDKLAATGFAKPTTFDRALAAFGAWYKRTRKVPAPSL